MLSCFRKPCEVPARSRRRGQVIAEAVTCVLQQSSFVTSASIAVTTSNNVPRGLQAQNMPHRLAIGNAKDMLKATSSSKGTSKRRKI
mmetsp:Transcript_20794/g.35019  ORF Transcript_20794/g.35019 Transcript_20794/m.35019 type:complete len:87 (+) Transcript_20794:1551-1811(+)